MAYRQQQMSLTAELERIEQKITLTLQEIDHNFARAHRIVTTSILPIVERYGKESEAVWQGSEFWKHFFEVSANVALTNYQDDDEATIQQTAAKEHVDDSDSSRADTTVNQTHHTYLSSPGHYTAEHQPASDSDDDLLNDSLLDSLTLTPKPTEWADMESPYEALTKELTTTAGNLSSSPSSPAAPPPTTPRNNNARRGYDTSSLSSSPFRPGNRGGGGGKVGAVGEDQVLHRMLDKTYRLAAVPTPSAARPSRYTPRAAPPTTPRRKPLFSRSAAATDFDSSPISSPPEPQLQTQIFTPRVLRTPAAARLEAALSVKKSAGGPGTATAGGRRFMYDSDDSDDDILLAPGFSPPKTMQFSLPPSKLLATPAREASRRIVHDILETAGAASADGTMTTEVMSSPVARRGYDDTDDDPF